jgi:hypothetical protein
MMRTLISQKPVNPIGEYACETKIGNTLTDLIIINKFGVPEDRWTNAKMLFNFLLMFYYLNFEFIPGNHTRQRMVVGFCQKFYAACCSETSETGEHFRGVFFELINGYAGNRERDPDVRVFADELQQQGICRQVTIEGNALHNLFIETIIKVRPVHSDVKKS